MASTLPLLFLGNSYTMNQALDQTVAALLSEGTGTAWEGSRLAQGGLTFESHVERAEGGHQDWERALTEESSQWSWVFLQEQSQIPGFPEHNSYVQGSVTAAGTLSGYAEARGAETVFVMTWGRRDGDPQNPSRYADFTTMQDHITEGYVRYVETWSTKERPVWLAPCGLAWQHIHDSIVADGSDPLQSGSLFDILYTGDGSHPSIAGNLLNAAVIYATLTGESPVGLSDPSGQLDKETTTALQEAAAAVVLGDSPDIDYPWEGKKDTPPEDTGKPADTAEPKPEDTASPEDTDQNTTGPEETGGIDQTEPEHGEPEAASGCSSRRAAMALPVLLLVLLGVRRR